VGLFGGATELGRGEGFLDGFLYVRGVGEGLKVGVVVASTLFFCAFLMKSWFLVGFLYLWKKIATIFLFL
jgi:hypothetical protein